MMRFNIDEVLAIAEQIERNGASFYRKAAEGLDEGDMRDMLLELSAMEEDHLRVFSSMRNSLAPSTDAPDSLSEEQDLYLRAYASGQIFDSSLDPLEALSSFDDIKDVLRFAIRLEKDSVVYYATMKQIVPDGWGRKEVDRIIKEEITHVAQLSDRLVSLGGV